MPGGNAQATTVPSALSATLLHGLAATATALLIFGGLEEPGLSGFPPQPTTSPFALTAKLNCSPAAIATALVKSVGTLHWPEELYPQANTFTSAKALNLGTESASTVITNPNVLYFFLFIGHICQYL